MLNICKAQSLPYSVNFCTLSTNNEPHIFWIPANFVSGDVAFQRDILEAHNALRTKHQCPHLTWCQDLAEQASEWAHHVAEKGRVLYKELPSNLISRKYLKFMLPVYAFFITQISAKM